MNTDSHAILRSSRAQRLVGMCAGAVVALITAGPSLGSDRVWAQGERPRGRQIIGMHRPPKGSDDKRPYIWNDPSVLREGTGYSMWASKGLGPKGVAIYKLSSRRRDLALGERRAPGARAR